MLFLWIHTLVDFLISVVQEHSRKEINITKDKLPRCSGWGMIFGTILFAFGFSFYSSKVRLFLYRNIGLPDNAEQYNLIYSFSECLGVVIALLGLFLITVGVLGLKLRYGKQVGKFGETSLWLSVVGGLVAITGMSAFFFDTGWTVYVVGILSQQLIFRPVRDCSAASKTISLLECAANVGRSYTPGGHRQPHSERTQSCGIG